MIADTRTVQRRTLGKLPLRTLQNTIGLKADRRSGKDRRTVPFKYDYRNIIKRATL